MWHECEAGSHSLCQVTTAVTQSWKPCQPIQQGGPGGTAVCLAVAPATHSGPSWDSPPLSSTGMRLPRTSVTDLRSQLMRLSTVATAKSRQLQTKSLLSPTHRNQRKKRQRRTSDRGLQAANHLLRERQTHCKHLGGRCPAQEPAAAHCTSRLLSPS